MTPVISDQFDTVKDVLFAGLCFQSHSRLLQILGISSSLARHGTLVDWNLLHFRKDVNTIKYIGFKDGIKYKVPYQKSRRSNRMTLALKDTGLNYLSNDFFVGWVSSELWRVYPHLPDEDRSVGWYPIGYSLAKYSKTSSHLELCGATPMLLLFSVGILLSY